MSNKTVKPEILGGFRDMLPRDALMLQEIVDIVRRVYESFGFLPLETPCMERQEVLTGGDPHFNKTIFIARTLRGTEDRGVEESWDNDFALRFDLTVSLARVVAAYPDLLKPFKRYQLGKVWRGESQQSGRFREFFQLDFDTIGSRSLNADIETIQVIYECLKELGIANFTIRFNTRKVLNGLAQVVQVGDRARNFFRILDKLDRIGADGVKADLMRQPDNEFDESAVALSESEADKVLGFLSIKDERPEDTLARLEEFFAGAQGDGQEGLAELRGIVEALDLLGIPRANWKLDLSVARGLDYYTGPVFETILNDYPELGSVVGGGRFDGLTNRFIPDSNIAGVGASVGVDRLIVGMQKLGLLKAKDSLTQVLVTIFDPKYERESRAMAAYLRRFGVRTELYLGEDRTLRAQFAYATKKGIPFVVVLGEEEIEADKVALKDMASRSQELLTREEVLAKLARAE
ncbi:MAG: histidine--tRNA ligase [Patescibacteria group bacterium]